MKSLEDTYTEIASLFQATQAHFKFSSNLELRFGDMLDESGREAEDASRNHIGLWIGILEQCIQWLALFQDMLGHAASTDAGERLTIPYAILGASIAQAVAIRRLSLWGLDTPARSLLRTLFESLDLANLTIFDPEAEWDFLHAGDEDGARLFWNKYVRKQLDKKTGKKLSRIDRALKESLAMSGHDDEYIRRVIEHHEHQLNLASRTVHLSLHAAMFTTKLLSADAHSLLPGRFGASSVFSVPTLAQASKWIWQFSRIVHPLLFKPLGEEGQFSYELQVPTEVRQNEQVAYAIMNALIVSHWTDDNVEIKR